MNTFSRLTQPQKLVIVVLGIALILVGMKTYKTTYYGGDEITCDSSQSSGCMGKNSDDSGMMHSMSAKTDEDFIMNMIPHHQEAVDTSAYLLTRTDNPELQKFVQGVIDVQTKEIAQMKQWHTDWFKTSYEDVGSYMPMMGDLSSYSGKELDAAYIEGMIVHHEGAVAMAKEILTNTQRPELKTMAQAIIKTQTQEIELLQTWLRDEYKDASLNEKGSMMDHRMMH